MFKSSHRKLKTQEEVKKKIEQVERYLPNARIFDALSLLFKNPSLFTISFDEGTMNLPITTGLIDIAYANILRFSMTNQDLKLRFIKEVLDDILQMRTE